MGRRIIVCHLYPDFMNLYGDRGNVIVLQRRCQWHGLEPELVERSLADRGGFSGYDIIFMGGGQDKEQRAICADFQHMKGEALKEAVEDDVPLLAICGAYQLLGNYFRTAQGEELPGTGLFDAWTVAGSKRLIGNVVVKSDLSGQERTLVGFENHSGQTFLGQGVRPLGTVVKGSGNNGSDRTEGAVYRHAIGTYLHGSVLPKNPWLADYLIGQALVRRYGEAGLRTLDDELEERAHRAAIKRTGETTP
ncbi:MAG: glutamine amidotransferase [Bacillota bacterium]